MKKTLTYLFFLVTFFGQLYAQDLHFTQFNLSPFTLNPAMAGNYEGSIRVGGIYRDQWASVLTNQFVTPSFYADAPLNAFGKNDWIGVGLAITNDKAGSAGLSNTHIMGTLAYHYAIGSRKNTILSFGVQGGVVQRRFDTTVGIYEDEIRSPGIQSFDRTNISDNHTFFDVQGGISVRSKVSERLNILVGLSMYHIGKPEVSFYSNGTYALPQRFSLHGKFDMNVTERVSFSPAFIFQKIEGANEMGVQAMLGYAFGNNKDFKLSLGPGYRLRDAFEAMLGINYKDFNLGIAYDFNISDLDVVSAGRGGYEIAASYIFKIYKKPKVHPTILCPRF